MCLLRGSFLLLGLSVLFLATAAEVLVQLNVNRPFNDVNEKFVSFSIKPEDLYNALDGSKRTTVTRLATLLGTSYVKLLGSYNFDKQNEVGMRNPTRVIWKGFNRWSRAVNWTMIIPIDYTPDEWEPMETLKVLNNSYLSGIHDCIYQFGTDSSVIRAKSYLEDMKTFDLMLEAFRPNVHKWLAMGADLMPGANIEEANRYVESSRDFNTAFGWKQVSDDKAMSAYQMDATLRALIVKKMPVWLNLPQIKRAKRVKVAALRNADDELVEGMKYAQVLGDAASTGFDVVFKYIAASDLENPTFSTYVAAIFKKVMGSRVFPAKPLHLFKQDQKLYTHCANGISGGMAFSAINKDERPMHITITSMTRLRTTEVWQYSLNMKKGQVLLNGEKTYLNSTLEPYVRTKTTNAAIKLVAPPLSVNYWVLPNVDLEHCQFLEIEEDDMQDSAEEQKIVKKRHSAAEKLLSQLIRETKIPKESFYKTLQRSRRFVDFNNNNKNRVARSPHDGIIPAHNLFENNLLNQETLGVFRQELTRRGRNALDWIQTILDIVRTYDDDDERNIRRRPRAAIEFASSAEEVAKKLKMRKTTDIRKKKNKKEKVTNAEYINEEDFFRELEELLKIIKPSSSEENASISAEESNESRASLKNEHDLFFKHLLDGSLEKQILKKDKKNKEEQNISKTLNELFGLEKSQNIKRKLNDKFKRKAKSNDIDQAAIDKNFNNMQWDLYRALLESAHEKESGEESTKNMNSDPITERLKNYSEEMPEKKISWWDEDDEQPKNRERRAAKLIVPLADSYENKVDSRERYFPRQPVKKVKQILVKSEEKLEQKNAANKDMENETLSPHNFLDTVTKRVVKFIDVVTRHVNNFQVKIQPNMENGTSKSTK